MASDKGIFGFSIGKKILMALTGLFLVLFLLEHLIGNFLLTLSDSYYFEVYAEFMGYWMNLPIRVMEVVLVGSLLIHIIRGLLLQSENAAARPVKYAVSAGSKNSSWFSRNMLPTGIIILVFLVIHLLNFWMDARFGVNVDFSGKGPHHDLYSKVHMHFSHWWYTLIYVVAFTFLGMHLNHGFQSAFQSMGWNHPTYTPLIKKLGAAYSIIVPLGFIAIAVYLFVFENFLR